MNDRPPPLPLCPRCEKPLTELVAQPAPPTPAMPYQPRGVALSCPHCDVLLGLVNDATALARKIRRDAQR